MQVTPVTTFSLAVNRYTKTGSGERKEETAWFALVTWRQLAEICERSLHKGSKVSIEGRLVQRKYTDNNGIERTAVEVIASDMKMLDKKPEAATEEVDSDPFPPKG